MIKKVTLFFWKCKLACKYHHYVVLWLLFLQLEWKQQRVKLWPIFFHRNQTEGLVTSNTSPQSNVHVIVEVFSHMLQLLHSSPVINHKPHPPEVIPFRMIEKPLLDVRSNQPPLGLKNALLINATVYGWRLICSTVVLEANTVILWRG